MATTVNSTGLDFTSIKNNLKQHLNKEEFQDYNFEASGLSNLLDVLAYNTHYNALIANFSLNESYISTAQLRSSLVGLATNVGYIPGSKTASKFNANVSITDTRNGAPSTYTLPDGFSITSTIDDKVFTFRTRSDAISTSKVSGVYTWENLTFYEGETKTKTFNVGFGEENSVYVIPDASIETETVKISVYDSPTSSNFTRYNSIKDTVELNGDSRIYTLKEAPNGHYELSFGNSETLGNVPVAGNKIVVEYYSVEGASANGANVFVSDTAIVPREYPAGSFVSTLVSASNASYGGSNKESIESIRKNAPFQYSAQNRMVTAIDYASLIKREYPSLIESVQCWGGEDNEIPDFGNVYVSLVNTFDETSSDYATRLNDLKANITSLAKNLGVLSFGVKFVDPVITNIDMACSFQYNPNATSTPVSSLETEVKETINSFFQNNSIGNFGIPFRRSNLLTTIDASNPAILSSRASIRMSQQLKFVPGVSANYSLTYPDPISESTSDTVVTSTVFLFGNKNCVIKNKPSSNVLQIIDASNDTIMVDNVGEVSPEFGKVNLIGFNPQGYVSGSTNAIFISVIPRNESAIVPSRNSILAFGSSLTTVSGVVTE